VSKILIIVCVAAALSATSGRWAHAHTGSGAGPDPKNDARLDENYLGKDYSGDPTGALISIITGTPGYLGGQLPPIISNPATLKQRDDANPRP
jgi:hypothetical protein